MRAREETFPLFASSIIISCNVEAVKLQTLSQEYERTAKRQENSEQIGQARSANSLKSKRLDLNSGDKAGMRSQNTTQTKTVTDPNHSHC